jgi:hypothetical protein
MMTTKNWLIEQYKGFEIRLAVSHIMSGAATTIRWSCKLVIRRLALPAVSSNLIDTTIYVVTRNLSTGDALIAAFSDALRQCDRYLNVVRQPVPAH